MWKSKNVNGLWLMNRILFQQEVNNLSHPHALILGAFLCVSNTAFFLQFLSWHHLLSTWSPHAQGEQPPQDGPWGEVIDENGNILYGNLTDLGEIQVDAEWMPDVPFINGQATYHRYLTPSGNIVVMPSASTLFFMALNPEEFGI